MNTKPGDRILEVGVGTGMLLPHYPRDVTVVGIDLSDGMLKQARRKCAKQQLDHCHLLRGDAMQLPFAEDSFDHVMLSHVVTVVSDPVRLMKGVARVVKDNGSVIVLNHFRSRNALVGWIEKITNPLFMRLGWRSDLRLMDTLTGVPLRVESSFKMRHLDLWTIVTLKPDEASRRKTVAKSRPEPVRRARPATVGG